MRKILDQANYILDPHTRVWARRGYNGISYNDGDEIELRIANIIRDAADVTVLSAELRQHFSDWPSLYHLSGTRANILRPFEASITGDVLEIGAGCGAITRYLGECGVNLLALEGSPRRAAIARARARGLENVTVIAEKFNDFRLQQQFDVITLIGVLEYANLFTPGENPAQSMLQRVRALLKPNGKLIIAIENQLGLKYFAGAPEDHLGQAMYGIEGRYKKDQPETFGRKALTDMMECAGFSTSEFLVPFPDYKLPVSIITKAGINNLEFDASAFAWQSACRDPQLPQYSNFSLELAWPALFKNGLALDVTNSFLIIASPIMGGKLTETNVLAYHYSTERVYSYCKETKFIASTANEIQVLCRQFSNIINEDPIATDQPIHFECPPPTKYSKGKPLSLEYLEIVTRDGWAFREVGLFLKKYIAILAKLLNQESLSSHQAIFTYPLPGNYFDLTPQNLIITPNGTVDIIDTEWSTRNPIELGHLLFRSLLWMNGLITRFGKPASKQTISKKEFIIDALLEVGCSLSENDISRYISIESAVQEHVSGRPFKWHPAQILPIHNLSQALVERNDQLANLGQIISENNRLISEKSELITEMEKQISGQNVQVSSLRQITAEQKEQLDGILNSTSWRITQPLRLTMDQIKRCYRLVQLTIPAIKRGKGLKNTLKKAKQLYRTEGIAGIRRGFRMVALSNQISPAEGSGDFDRNDYTKWIEQYDTITDDVRTTLRKRIETFKYRPLISIVMPTYNPKQEWLVEAIESVRKQIYPNWELCISDDASTNKSIQTILERYVKEDSRIKVIFRKQNGHISAASNSGLEIVTGQWVALLDHDDLLPEHALFWVAEAINQDQNIRLMYSDEDKIDNTGNRTDPYFKCNWNRSLFYSQNMISHLGIYQTRLIKEVGGFRQGFEGSQDYDLALRCIERIEPQQIYHIPRILYHWRIHATSTAQSADAKPYAMIAAENALNEHFKREMVNATAKFMGCGYRTSYALPDQPPLVSLIIPTRNDLQLIQQCIESILQKTTYPSYEILIIDNGSNEPAVIQYFNKLTSEPRVRIVHDNRPFNYSALNNSAVKLAKGEIIGLINNDIEVISSDWLSEMVSFALQPHIGAVGAKLLYPDNTLQHGGIILGVGGIASHYYRNSPHNYYGKFGRESLTQEFSAVTASCLVIRKSVYEAVGGLNEKNLGIAFNDVDFCLRIQEVGYNNIWTPYAKLYHHQSTTHGFENTPEQQARFANEITYMTQCWGEALKNDPAYNPNLTLDYDDFSLAWPPRI